MREWGVLSKLRDGGNDTRWNERFEAVNEKIRAQLNRGFSDTLTMSVWDMKRSDSMNITYREEFIETMMPKERMNITLLCDKELKQKMKRAREWSKGYRIW